MSQNCLKLNTGKTEVLFFGHDASFWQPSWWPQELGEIPNPVSKVKNLGVYFDTKLPFEGQISTIASTCFFTIKTNRKIWPIIPLELQKAVVTALILSQIDYCIGLFLNIQSRFLNKMQVLQNAAAHLLLAISKHQSVARALPILHWLPVKRRIKFKALCIAFKALHGLGLD